ncbi:hatching enzyme 1.2-like [Haematobia irritans]|uniref:hatching enzyme 1.2-like n=1 Tax=Haematobia irritans TaxID=7368 RepID=UPI003F4FCF93
MSFLKSLAIVFLSLRLIQSRPLNIKSFQDPLNIEAKSQEGQHLISSIYEGLLPQDPTPKGIQFDANDVDNEHDTSDVFDLSIYGRSLYRIPDSDMTGKLLETYKADTSPVNPEELGSYVEGDIVMPQSSVILKNGLTTKSTRWPNGIIPYEIGGKFQREELNVIANAINEYHQRTCIRFVPRSSETDYIIILNGRSGCWSSIGRVGGKQEVNLQTPGCLSKPGTAMHELMHVLGFLHEQNRQERDSFVDIQYKNIKKAAYENFKKITPTAAFGVPYDYGSVMHYSAKAFSQNGEPTIVAKQSDGNTVMGQRMGFSNLDIEKINRMYNCYENPKSNIPPPVDLADSNDTFFHPGKLIGDIFDNVVNTLHKVGK